MSERKLKRLKEKKFQTEHLMEMLEASIKRTAGTYGMEMGGVLASEKIKTYVKLKEKLFQINHKIKLLEGLENTGEQNEN